MKNIKHKIYYLTMDISLERGKKMPMTNDQKGKCVKGKIHIHSMRKNEDI